MIYFRYKHTEIYVHFILKWQQDVALEIMVISTSTCKFWHHILQFVSVSTLHLSSAAVVELTQNQTVSKAHHHLILLCSPMEEEGKEKKEIKLSL